VRKMDDSGWTEQFAKELYARRTEVLAQLNQPGIICTQEGRVSMISQVRLIETLLHGVASTPPLATHHE